MKHQAPQLGICVWQIDGSARSFVLSEPDLINHTITELHSGTLFNQDRIIIADEDSQASFLPPRITRIDLLTDVVTVWDFPFVFGALIELSEGEFLDGVRSLSDLSDFQTRTRLFLDTEAVSGQRTCLWMDIVAGFPAARMAEVYSLFNERQLIFGLREGGVGILNPANVARFAVFPEPVPVNVINGSGKHANEKPSFHAVYDRSRNGKPLPASSLDDYPARTRFDEE